MITCHLLSFLFIAAVNPALIWNHTRLYMGINVDPFLFSLSLESQDCLDLTWYNKT